MKLKDTVELMLSTDYKDRFIAEYHQVRIRYNKLADMVRKCEAGELDFVPTCSLDVLRRQLDAMARYMVVLVVRAQAEGVDLGEDGEWDV